MNAPIGSSAADGGVVVGVDEDTPQQAVDWAAAHAVAEGHSVVLVNATGSPGTVGTTWLQSANIVRPAAERVRRAHPDLEVRTLIVANDPAQELLELTRSARLLVLGPSSRWLARLIPGWRLGARLANGAECPVVVVPAHDPGRVRRGVLVGTDASPRSRDALMYAFRYASRHELPLTVARITREKGQALAHEARMLAEAVGALSDDHPDVAVSRATLRGWPARTLVDMSEDMHLLVVGRHHAIGLDEPMTGHVRTSLVDKAACPVAVVPQVSTSRSGV